MKINQNDAILTPRLLLVPYCAHHVPTYHEWMQDTELQRLTASEPLSLAEEYAMQASWRNDADKLTFIICTSPLTLTSSDIDQSQAMKSGVEPGKQDSPQNMLGDVNLFLNDDDCQEEESKLGVDCVRGVIGEIEIMIAQEDARGKGMAKETLLAFLGYITNCLAAVLAEYSAAFSKSGSICVLKYFRVKIHKHNIPSVKLFKRLGFVGVEDSPNFFGELELRMVISEDNMKMIEEMGSVGTTRKLVYHNAF